MPTEKQLKYWESKKGKSSWSKDKKFSKEHIRKRTETRQKNGWFKNPKKTKEKMSASGYINATFLWKDPEYRKHMSDVHKGKTQSEATIKKRSDSMKGKSHPCSKETKKKIGKANSGRYPSEETRRKNSEANKGEKGNNWQGGITSENHKIRDSFEMRLFKTACFERDNYTDQKIGIRGGKLIVHHILNFSQYPELRFDVKNGITLSKESHILFHKTYGYRNNTREQIEEFLKSQ